MVKVITYGTYDLLHYGHIKLLERAKGLGDYTRVRKLMIFVGTMWIFSRWVLIGLENLII